MHTISLRLTIGIRKEKCPEGTKELGKFVNDLVFAAHRDVCDRFHAHGFTVDTEAINIYLPGGKDG